MASPRGGDAGRTGGGDISYDEHRARWAAIRSDQQLIDQATAKLRHDTAQAQYVGLQHPEIAFGLAAVLDELSRHLRDVDEDVRRQTVESCRAMLDDPD